MKTLLIALCLVLLVSPAGAQQNTGRPTPNFYVPFGIRDAPPIPMESESSSDEIRIAEPGQRVNASLAHPYPMRRRQYRAVQQGHGPRFQPLDSIAGAVVGAVAVAVLIAALAGGDH